MAPCGWCRPSLIWAVMLGETESVADWCLSNPLVGWLLALHTAGYRHSVCVGTARWKNRYHCGLTSVVVKKHQSAEKKYKAAICATKGCEWDIMCPCLYTDEMNYKKIKKLKERVRERKKSVSKRHFKYFINDCNKVLSHCNREFNDILIWLWWVFFTSSSSTRPLSLNAY